MKKARWISAAIGTAVLTAGFVLPASAAFADGPSGNGNAGVLSLLSGNDVNAPVSAPIDVCGVAVALLGGANAGCEGGAASNTVILGGNGGSGSGNAGGAAIGSGNNVTAPVSVPVSVCGVSGAVGGFANSGCQGGAASNTVILGGNGGSDSGNAGGAAIGSGNNVTAPVSVPVDLCGISVALAGFSDAGCQGGSFSNTVINP
jgi:ChpA-C